MALTFRPGQPDYFDRLNEMAAGQINPVQADWNAAPGSVKAIANKPALNNVDNTRDADKPLSGPQQAALAAKADVVSTGMKNRLINGDFRIMQRGIISGGGNILDRWFLNIAGGMGGANQFTGPNFGGYVSTVATIVGATGNTGSNLYQLIEADNCQDLVGKQVTLSYWFFHTSGSAQNINSVISSANTRNNFSALTFQGQSASVVVPSGVWARLTHTLTLGAGTENGLQVLIGSGMGAFNATQNIAFGDVQLELGSQATPFDRRPVGLELAMCQRYYRQVTVDHLGYGMAGDNLSVCVPLSGPMRASPSVTRVFNDASFGAVNAPANSSAYIASSNKLTVYRTAAATGHSQFSETVALNAELS